MVREKRLYPEEHLAPFGIRRGSRRRPTRDNYSKRYEIVVLMRYKTTMRTLSGRRRNNEADRQVCPAVCVNDVIEVAGTCGKKYITS